MSLKQFVESIEFSKEAKGTGSKAIKKNAIDQCKNSNIAKRLFAEAMSPYRVFGIKKIPNIKSFSESDADIEVFFKLLDDLHDRIITGNAARDKIVEVLSLYTLRTSNILKSVLLKDLKAGFSAETVNEVFTGEKKPINGAIVELFAVMLAKKIEDDTNHRWIFPCLAEFKYDGLRTIAIIENGKVQYLARSGKIHHHLFGLFDDELQKIENILGYPVVLDCEVQGSDFTESIKAKNSKNDKAKDNLILYTFDILSLDEWKSKSSKKSQLSRTDLLTDILNKLNLSKIKKSEHKICHNYTDVKEFYDKALSDGFEGLIIKNIHGLYEWDRSNDWLKWKPVITVDGVIIDFYPGRKGTTIEKYLGGIVVKGTDENGVEFLTKCGSGFKLPQRKEIWENKDKYLGKMVELEAQEICKSDDNEYHSLRFPVFKKFRPDKD